MAKESLYRDGYRSARKKTPTLQQLPYMSQSNIALLVLNLPVQTSGKAVGVFFLLDQELEIKGLIIDLKTIGSGTIVQSVISGSLRCTNATHQKKEDTHASSIVLQVVERKSRG